MLERKNLELTKQVSASMFASGFNNQPGTTNMQAHINLSQIHEEIKKAQRGIQMEKTQQLTLLKMMQHVQSL